MSSPVNMLLFLMSGIFLAMFHQTEGSFTCTTPGKFVDPINETRYHQCVYLYGKLTHIPNKCPRTTCFSQKLNYCVVEACKGHKPPTTSYNCTNFNFTCNSTGVFAHPNDSSVYFKCGKEESREWQAICFTCNRDRLTCFDNSRQACIPSMNGKSCNGSNITTTTGILPIKNQSISSNCAGYSEFPCAQLGPGTHGMPGDTSVYWECVADADHDGKLQGHCKTCPGNGCFLESLRRCVDNCDEEEDNRPYKCSTFKEQTFPCRKQGFVADPTDTSIFFYCSEQNDKFDAYCFTCSSDPKTCFSHADQTCIAHQGERCPDTNVINPGTGIPSTTLTYDCSGYNERSFPCEKFGIGQYESPADMSVYFTCVKVNNSWIAKCHSCPKQTFSCYDGEIGKCVEYCDNDKASFQYECDIYKNTQFDCKDVGYYPHPDNTAIYFGCGKNENGNFESRCFSCNMYHKTCFEEEQKACITNSGKSCGSKEELSKSISKGRANDSWTYSCDGYANSSFPCQYYEDGNYRMPGDASVYVECRKHNTNDKNALSSNMSPGFKSCSTCSKTEGTCYDESTNQCRKDCNNIFQAIPYNCNSGIKYNCTKEGIYANPNDTSIYFKCINRNGEWKSVCFTCNNKTKTCFSEHKRGCVTNAGHPCGNASTPDAGGKVNESRTYDCSGYDIFPTTCSELGVGVFTLPGDRSVYITCTENGDEFEVDCKVCPNHTRSCFLEKEQRCVENCGRHTPYNCSWYDDKSYPCTKEGYFAHPKESSVYFRCIRKGQNWQALCHTCSSEHHTCFSEVQQACLPSTVKRCGNATHTNSTVTNNSTSLLTYSCTGYNSLSFPCPKVGLGTYVNPMDNSVYFSCVEENGHIIAQCRTCPNATKSCYIEDHKKCIENCGKGPDHKPYNCATYTDTSYPCTKEGIYANPNDTSIYFKCINRNGEWKSVCFTCNNKTKTCFNEHKRGCVTNAGHPCGNASTPDAGGKVNESRTYDCSGYDIFPTTCSELGVGVFTLPGDRSVYITCTENGDEFEVDCKVCPNHTRSCFLEKEQRCVENCGRHTPYNCSWYDDKSYPCTKEGYFAHPKESSVYFRCIRKGQNWQALCHTCSSEHHTCFSEVQQACLPSTVKRCGNATHTNSTVTNNSTSLVTYSCTGYNSLSFPCPKVGLGTYVNPMDNSVYFSCVEENGHIIAQCRTCPNATKSCYIEDHKKCIENCGKGPDHKPYNCATYTDTSYPCTKEGIYANPNDTSIYFKCINRNGEWKSVCFTCNNKTKTCFSEHKRGCVTNAGHPCGNASTPDAGGKVNESRTYDCSGYDIFPTTCSELGVGVFTLPGDRSVYITCTENGDEFEVDCKVCPNHTRSCFLEKEQRCVENCGRHTPYNCSWYDDKSYPCTKEGYFAHPKESSVYFRCIRKGQNWQALCHTCSSEHHTCFSEVQQACLPSTVKRCGNATHTNSTVTNNSTSLLTYSCTGYNSLSFPCPKVGLGTYVNPMDNSVYFSCVEENGHIIAQCRTCPNATKSCYIEDHKKCIENCGKGPDHKPYNCATYTDTSYPCTKEGIYANPNDTSIYFKCINRNGEWKSVCFTCNNKTKTCFNEHKRGCVTNAGHPCGNASTPDAGGKVNESRTYDCSGYDIFPTTCSELGVGVFTLPGDRSVYITCTENGDEFEVDCKVCPNHTRSCFLEKEQRCVENCGRHTPYNCSWYDDKSYPCTKEGYFAHPKESSVYFRCIRKGQNWQALCHTCSSEHHTCFSEVQQACLPSTVKRCGNATHTNSTVTNNSTSLVTYSCTGYNSLSFPCPKVGLGTYVNPMDNSVYFSCVEENGHIIAQCRTCPNATKSCYIEDHKKCIENCGKGPDHKPYNCATYTDTSYPCTKEGIYANPNDTSIYFKCINRNGEWKSVCFTCNNKTKTCFNEHKRGCVTNAGHPCGNASTPDAGGKVNESRTYDCSGYDILPTTCSELGVGVFTLPGDRSVYITCTENGDEFEVDCKVCPNHTRSCFLEKEQRCVENCGRHTPYNCSWYDDKSYPCTKEGYFAHPKESSVYFRCIRKGQNWQALCHTCSSEHHTCFSEVQQACLPSTVKRCGNATHTNSTVTNNSTSLVTYSCTGYNSLSFPCPKVGLGTYVNPMDNSVYFSCVEENGHIIAQCRTCPNATKSCYIEDHKKCIENCGKGPDHKPYNCATYTDTSYPCTKEGIYANPNDTSIYFKCINRNGEWKSVCFTCNNKTKTCFNEHKRGCVTNAGHPCGNASTPDAGGKVNESRTYDCSGYDILPTTCSELGVGVFTLPGDRSVYITCTENGDEFEVDCKVCPNHTRSCFLEKEQRCVENCGRHTPYNCSWYDDKSYPCTKEGYFAHPKESSVYFRCIRKGQNWQALCHTCSSEHHTCFSEVQQACLPSTVKRCGNATHTNSTVTNNSTSLLTYSCTGYNSLSFPCPKVGLGTYVNPMDNSVYFSCVEENGHIIAQCRTCPNATKSCYIEDHKKCIENCGKGPDHKPYNCATYTDTSYPCTKEGIYANPNDTSIYFKCINRNGGWKSVCFTCNNKTKTCFSEHKRGCVTNAGHPCGNASTPDAGGKVNESRTYDCSGYDIFPTTCSELGVGVFTLPGDRSVYITCTENGDEFEVDCKVCPNHTRSCFLEKEQRCVENCGRHTPYNCSWYDDKSYPCTKEGYFAHPKESSVYFRCIRKGQNWQALCHTCSSEHHTCFSEVQQACLPSTVKRCGNATHTNSTVTNNSTSLVTYSCTGYNSLSFPCPKVGLGTYVNPMDNSVYFSCVEENGHIIAQCRTCPNATKSCYIEDHKKCIENCGKGPDHKPYNCATYTDTSYPCTKEGIYANPNDTSIYFKCINRNGEWKSVCFTCNNKTKTCFNEHKRGCVTNAGHPCGNASTPDAGGKVNESRTYDCSGYDILPTTCSELGVGVFTLPGDRSVYITCTENGDEFEVDCKVCPNHTRSCFLEKEQRCVENCGKHTPYNCSWYDDKSYPCTKEGYFAHPKESSVYFRCIRKGQNWQALCHTCSSEHHTCFSDVQQACLPSTVKGCGNATHTNSTVTNNSTSLLTYSCTGYNSLSFPCPKVGLGTYVNPMDNSVYFSCVEENGHIIAQCRTCPNATKSCYIEDHKKCIENCGKGPDHKPYNCATYTDTSYPCTKEGIYANPNDTSIYFKCINRNGEWKSVCFTCNNKTKTCFNEHKRGCVTNAGHPCGNASTPDAGGKVNESRTYDCSGYDILPTTCSELGVGVFTLPGDRSVYITCTENGDEFEVDCKVCPNHTRSCFLEKEQRCVENCGKHTPYNCSWYDDKSYPCTKEGYFAHPKESSVYFRCIRKGQNWQALCHTCSSEHHTCFSDVQQACLPSTVKGCGNATHTNSTVTNNSTSLLTYSCTGYNSLSFPCPKVGLGTYVNPMDNSVYFSCVEENGHIIAQCRTCPNATKSCYIEDHKKCIENCGKGPDHKPYNCATYTDTSYPCTKEGIYANPNDTSIYFKCINRNGEWKSVCFTCNNKTKTCFNEHKRGCVTNAGHPCGNASTPDAGGKVNESRTYDCSGYDILPTTCSELGVGVFTLPGDRSVYITCTENGDEFEVDCKVCPNHTRSCFLEKEQRCVENCGRHTPYNCSWYDDKSYPCTKEGYFAHPKESSVYFRCIRKGQNWQALCHTCSSEHHTCFSEVQQACLPSTVKRCGNATHTNSTVTNNSTSLVTYSCTGYNSLSFPCPKVGLGTYVNPMDNSVYFSCVEENGHIIAQCRTCPNATKSCYIEDHKKCIENCGKGPDHKPYNCATYTDTSYPCTKEGIYANPNDTSIYFKCINRNGEWKSVCFTCNNKTKTCFNQEKGLCVSNPHKSCGTNVNISGTASHTWDCSGYAHSFSACASLGFGVFAFPGDTSVALYCLKEGKKLKPLCKACPKDTKSCFIDKEKACIENCGKGPDHQPYNCKTYSEKSFPCSTEGVHANPNDSSIYFNCIRQNNQLNGVCFSCSNTSKSCFNEVKKTCVSNGGKACGTKSMSSGSPLSEFDCSAYSHSNSACDILGTGNHAIPGDASIYLACNDKTKKLETQCTSCPQNPSRKCFNPTKKDCSNICDGDVDPSRFFNCSVHNTKSYPCTKIGFFPHPEDSSVYFQCVKIGKTWESYCFACDRKKKTCFSKSQQRCLPLEDKEPCGKRDPVDFNTNLNYRGYSCKGYGPTTKGDQIFPCSHYRPGTFLLFGDRSVYFTCQANLVAQCHTCDPKKNACFDQVTGACVSNCWGSPPVKEQYQCAKSLKLGQCTKDGIFVFPHDTSSYYKCIDKGSGKFRKHCYSCSSKAKTCFNPDRRSCMKTSHEGEGCRGLANTIFIGDPVGGRSYSCEGFHTECKPQQVSANYYTTPGDTSVYMRCTKEGGNAKKTCKVCPKNTCFDRKEQKCIRKCVPPGDWTESCKTSWNANCLYVGIKQK